MNQICENTAALELVSTLIEKEREPHSIIITGEKGLGKKTLAKAVAAQLLCEKGNGASCGKCRQCRLIESGAHPDLLIAEASETGNYKVEHIRSLISNAYSSPTEGKFTVILIPDLDRSVQTLKQIQNILLKLIEEPPDSAIIILTMRSKELFLDTIISRAIHLQVEEVSFANTLAYLTQNGFDPQLSEEAARRCGGNIGRCLDYCENEKTRLLAEAALNAANALASFNEYQLLKELSSIDGKKDSFIETLFYFKRIVRDSCRIRAGAVCTQPFSQRVCSALAADFSETALAEIYDTLSDFSSRASANCLISTLTNALTARLMQQ